MREEGERCEWREWCEEKLVAALHKDEVRVVWVERSLGERRGRGVHGGGRTAVWRSDRQNEAGVYRPRLSTINRASRDFSSMAVNKTPGVVSAC
jgi:hypothetical protein